jgi:hypothetical protein
MSLREPAQFSDHLVFVDESGDHGLTAINRDFPLFTLAFCVFSKVAYAEQMTPVLRRLKLAAFGHDMVVLHEHDIRKKEGAFARMSREPREAFLDALTRIIAEAAFALVAVVIDKRTNSEGLQLADMVARPVALSVLRPDQPNRAMEVLREKLWRGPGGQVEGYGLKCFPEKNAGPPGSPSGPAPNG